jgi:hypothetical protein
VHPAKVLERQEKAVSVSERRYLFEIPPAITLLQGW